MNKNQLMKKIKALNEGEIIKGANKGKEYHFKGIEEYRSRGKSPKYDGELVVVLFSEERKRRNIKLFIKILEYFVKHDGKYISHGRLPPEYCEKFHNGVDHGVPRLFDYENHYKALANHLCKIRK